MINQTLVGPITVTGSNTYSFSLAFDSTTFYLFNSGNGDAKVLINGNYYMIPRNMTVGRVVTFSTAIPYGSLVEVSKPSVDETNITHLYIEYAQ